MKKKILPGSFVVDAVLNDAQKLQHKQPCEPSHWGHNHFSVWDQPDHQSFYLPRLVRAKASPVMPKGFSYLCDIPHLGLCMHVCVCAHMHYVCNGTIYNSPSLPNYPPWKYGLCQQVGVQWLTPKAWHQRRKHLICLWASHLKHTLEPNTWEKGACENLKNITWLGHIKNVTPN